MTARPLRVSLTVAAAALLLAGCGGAARTAPSTSASPSAAAPSAAPLRLEQRLVQGDLAGIPPRGEVQVDKTVGEFLAADASAGVQGADLADTLSRAGFVQAASQQHAGQAGLGTSGVVQLGGPAQATAVATEMQRTFTKSFTDQGVTPTSGTVPGLPDSHTLTAAASGGSAVIVTFADGPFVYFVAAFGKSVKSSEVNDTVTILYERVKGAPPA